MKLGLDRSEHGSFREEVQVLRKRVLELEASHAESEQLRKDIAVVQGEKASLEKDFMNQMNVLARENSLVVEELEGRLLERTNINVALNEQLQNCLTPEMVEARIREVESLHKQEMTSVTEEKRAQTTALHNEISTLHASNVKLNEEIAEMRTFMGENQKETNSLKSRIYTLQAERSQMVHVDECEQLKEELRTLEQAYDDLKHQHQTTTRQQASAGSLINQLNQSESTVAGLRECNRGLELELSNTIAAAETEIQRLEDEVSSRNAQISQQARTIRKLESDLEAQKKSHISTTDRLEKENKDLQRSRQQLEAGHRELISTKRSLEAELKRSAEIRQTLTNENQKLKEEKIIPPNNRFRSTSLQVPADAQYTGRLQEEYIKIKKSHEVLEEDNRALRMTQEILKRERPEVDAERRRLENENYALRDACRALEENNHKLESEYQERKTHQKSRQQDYRGKQSIQGQRPERQSPASPRGEFESRSDRDNQNAAVEHRDAVETRTTQIIRRLEQNLKREGQHKQTLTAGLKSRKHSTESDFDSPSRNVSQDDTDFVLDSLKLENKSLSVEVDELKQKLGKERETVMQLRRECADMKSPSVRSQHQGQSQLPLPSPSSPPVVQLASPSKFRLNRSRSFGPSDAIDAANEEQNDPRRGRSERSNPTQSMIPRKSPRSFSASRSQTRRELQPSSMPQKAQQPVVKEGGKILASKGPRTPVRGLVQNFERRISQLSTAPSEWEAASPIQPESPTTRPPHSHTPKDANLMHPTQVPSKIVVDDAGESKRTLKLEQQHVRDLEKELSRQCEVNTSLLKEIDSLTNEAEASRINEASRFEQTCHFHRKEVDNLSSEIARLRSRISQSEGTRSNLSKRYEQSSAADKREIATLQSQVELLEVRAAKAHEEILSLQEKIRSDEEEIKALNSTSEALHSQMVQTEAQKLALDEELDQIRRSHVVELEQLNSQIEQLKSQIVEGDDIQQQLISEKKDKERVEEINADLCKDLERLKMELKDKNDQLERLESSIDQLNSRIDELELQKEKLCDERRQRSDADEETIRSLNIQVDELSKKLRSAETEKENMSRDFMESSCSDKDQIQEVNKRVETLQNDLTKVTAERDELAENLREHQEDFDGLQEQVEKKVQEFEAMRCSDVEQIERLKSQVEALRHELGDTLAQVEDLKSQLEDKEGVEATVEELTRMNQRSLDSQINKLQTQLTKTQVEKSGAETDYTNKIKELQATIDEMASESEQTVTENEQEISDLKECISVKNSVIERLGQEKEQLVLSMKTMSNSRKDEIEELQVELMDMSTKAANQAREVQLLKLQIEETGFQKESIDNLRIQVRELQAQLIEREGSRMHEKTSLEVENSELRQRLRAISIERQEAEEKLRDYVSDKGNSKSIQVLRERNAALKFEVEKLTRMLQKVELRVQHDGQVKPTRFTI